MMNPRILELIKAPEKITDTDISLLDKEISSHPYMQSLRALKLLAISKFDQPNYAAELTKTAAFTTDKKILFQLINGRPLETSIVSNSNSSAVQNANSDGQIVANIATAATETKKSSDSEDLTKISNVAAPLETSGVQISHDASTLEEKINIAQEELPEEKSEVVKEAKEQLQNIGSTQNTEKSAEKIEKIISNETEIPPTDISTVEEKVNIAQEELPEEKQGAVAAAKDQLSNLESHSEAGDALKTIDSAAKSELNASDISTVEEQVDIAQEELPKEKSKKVAEAKDELKSLDSSQDASQIEGKIAQVITKVTENPAADISEVEEKVNVAQEELSEKNSGVITPSLAATEFNPVIEGVIGRDEVQPTALTIDGKRNRILFEGEEDFLDQQEGQKIDLELSKEAGKLVTEKPLVSTVTEKPTADDIEVMENAEAKVNAEYEDASILNPAPEAEDNKSAETQDSGVSYVAIDEFLPQVKMEAPREKVENAQITPSKPTENRHEAEMRKLLEEVERKMQEKKAKEIPKPEVQNKSENNSEEKISEEIEMGTEKAEVEERENRTSKAALAETTNSKTEPEKTGLQENEMAKPASTADVPVQNTGWKPMQPLQTKMDAAIDQKSSVNDQKSENKKTVGKIAEQNSEAQVLKESKEELQENSAASNDNDSGNVEQKISDKAIIAQEEVQSETETSNVPTFINTWQNWLKISPKKEIVEEVVDNQTAIGKTDESEKVANVKALAIEKFIENEPKISQLKDETSFVLKERSDDISHLMTETLASIYAEQKLYAKSIKAFEILIEKHPDRKEYFKSKIAEVKELRTKNNQLNS